MPIICGSHLSVLCPGKHAQVRALKPACRRRVQVKARPDSEDSSSMRTTLNSVLWSPVLMSHLQARKNQENAAGSPAHSDDDESLSDDEVRQLHLAATIMAPLAAIVSAAAEEGVEESKPAEESETTDKPPQESKASSKLLPRRLKPAPAEAKRVSGVYSGSGMFDKFRKQASELRRDLLREDPIPPIGSARISYAKLLQLLHAGFVKRLTILADGKIALVEIPINLGGHDYDYQRYDPQDYSSLYAKEFPEWQMEMIRYYVELPGDFFAESNLHQLVKDSMPHRTGDGYAQYDWLTQADQYRMEIDVQPPPEGWQWARPYYESVALILILMSLRGFINLVEWLLDITGHLRGPQLTKREKELVELSKSIATAYNMGENGLTTGVTMDDVQGVDDVKEEVKEILTMLLGDEKFQALGAKVPRGVLMEGPPGTGKTYMARAMATYAGVPFFSANGAEFVQMYQGVAVGRMANMFLEARKNKPAIIFIDEIDAIGGQRDPSGATDPGSAEREKGLLQLLVEMDGLRMLEGVLVIGATNRPEDLDDALMRPGRFDRVIHMGLPTPENRYRILAVHAGDKQIPRDNDDFLLREAARRAKGYSGAMLANMLNEAAILQIRYAKSEVDMDIIQEVLDKDRVGFASDILPDSEAKRHLASIFAGKAVATALSTGADVVERVSLKIVGESMGRIVFHHGKQHSIEQQGDGDFELCVNLMVPLYAPRATEEVLYGPDRVTLATAPLVAAAGNVARWLCIHSRINPALWGVKSHLSEYCTVTQYLDTRALEELVLRIQTLAYHRALIAAHERKTAILTITEELLADSDSTVMGWRLDEIVKQEPDPVSDEVIAGLPYKHFFPEEAAPDLLVEEKAVVKAIGLVKGDIDIGMFFDRETLENISKAFKDESSEWYKKVEERNRYADQDDAPFPTAPALDDKTLVV